MNLVSYYLRQLWCALFRRHEWGEARVLESRDEGYGVVAIRAHICSRCSMQWGVVELPASRDMMPSAHNGIAWAMRRTARCLIGI